MKNVRPRVEQLTELVHPDSEFAAYVRLKYFVICAYFFSMHYPKFNFILSIVALACGGTASENNTFIVQASATAVSSPCSYTICQCSTDICRIRFDLTVIKMNTSDVSYLGTCFKNFYFLTIFRHLFWHLLNLEQQYLPQQQHQ